MKENHNRVLVITKVCHSPNEIQEGTCRTFNVEYTKLENMVNIKGEHNSIEYFTYLYNHERFEKHIVVTDSFLKTCADCGNVAFYV